MHTMRGCKKNSWVRHSLPFVTACMGLSKWPCDASPILVDYLRRLFGIGIRLDKNKHLTVVIGRCVCPPSLKCKQFLLHYIWLAPFQLSVLACDIVGVPVWTSFGALLKLLSKPCLWTYFPLFLDRTFGSVLALVHSLPCQGLHDPIINSYGTVPVGEGRVCTGSCLAPSSSLPIPQPAPKQDIPVIWSVRTDHAGIFTTGLLECCLSGWQAWMSLSQNNYYCYGPLWQLLG